MQIRPTSNAQRTQAVNLQTRTNAPASPANNSTALPVDQLDISPQAQAMSAASNSGEVRMDRVADIRAQIANGTYETSARLDAAVGQILDQFA